MFDQGPSLKILRVRILPLLFVLTLLAGCQSTAPIKEWRRADDFGAPKNSVAVLVAAYRPEIRAQYENAIVAALAESGVAARPTYNVLPLQQAKASPSTTIPPLGTEGFLAVRLADPTSVRAYEISGANSGEPLAPWQNWFDFFTTKGTFNTAPVGASGREVGIHAAFYDSASGKLLWSATTVRSLSPSRTQSAQVAAVLNRLLSSAALIP